MKTGSSARVSAKAATATLSTTSTHTKTDVAILAVLGLAAAAGLGYGIYNGFVNRPVKMPVGSISDLPPGYSPDSYQYCEQKCRIAYTQCLARASGMTCLTNFDRCISFCPSTTPGYLPPGYVPGGYSGTGAKSNIKTVPLKK